jgi:hypothetical protein
VQQQTNYTMDDHVVGNKEESTAGNVVEQCPRVKIIGERERDKRSRWWHHETERPKSGGELKRGRQANEANQGEKTGGGVALTRSQAQVRVVVVVPR